MSASSDARRSDGPQETEALGARLASTLRPGDVVLLEGEVGSGKTTLVRGALRALGHHGRVPSPTFTLARRYDDARIPVSHLDLYRLAEVDADAEDLAILDDELGPGRIAFVEWPGAAPEVLAGRHGVRRIVLRHAGADVREIEGIA